MSTNDARFTRVIKSSTVIEKATSTEKKFFTSKVNLNFKYKPVKCYIWSRDIYGAETWTLRKVDQKYLENSEMWCCGIMETISWTDRVRNVEVLHTVNEERDILHTLKRGNANWIGHILRMNCVLKPATERKIDERDDGKTKRRRKQLLDDLKEIR